MEETQEGEVALRFDTVAIVDQVSNILPHILQLSNLLPHILQLATLSTDRFTTNFRQFNHQNNFCFIEI